MLLLLLLLFLLLLFLLLLQLLLLQQQAQVCAMSLVNQQRHTLSVTQRSKLCSGTQQHGRQHM
jgi:uncharacterized membrane protein YgcG